MNRPSWIKAKAPDGAEYHELRNLVESARLHTVCQSACCPNIGECWRERTATFMILGNTCTRDCRFCAVPSCWTGAANLKRLPLDEDEPRRVAEAVKYLGLKHAVITSVTRDDLPDGGASIFAQTIVYIQNTLPECAIEVLIPDFQGSSEALRAVVDAKPDILNHNIETVSRCYPQIRPQAEYRRSIELLRKAKEFDAKLRTKSGIMVGVSETGDELMEAMRDLRSAGCDILTIGQYLAPTPHHHPISRYYTPEEFDQLRATGLEMGFSHVESGPLVRSSYHAASQTSPKLRS